MYIFQEFVKVYDQIRSKKNIFGYKTSTGNKLYLAYLLIGGVYTSDSMNQKLRKCYVICNQVSTIVILSTIFPCFFLLNASFLEMFYLAFAPNMLIYILYLLPLTLHIYKGQLEEVNRLIDSKMETIIRKAPGEDREITIYGKKFLIRLILIVLFASVPFIDSIFFYDEKKIHDFKYFIAPVFFSRYLTSSQILFVESVWNYLLHNFFYLTFLSFSEYVDSVTTSLHVLCVQFCQDLQQQSNMMRQRIENLQKEELKLEKYNMNDKYLAYSRTRLEKKAIQEEFMVGIRRMVNEFQEMTRLVSCFKPFLQIHGSLVYLAFTAIGVAHAYIILNENELMSIRIREVIIFVITADVYLTICIAGAKFSDLTSMSTEAVYDIPWYCFTPIQRTTIYISLCQVQRTNALYAVKVYPLDRRAFIRMLNIIYSITNFMRRVF